MSTILHAILPPLIGLRVTEYVTVACTALLVYDYFLTLDREVFFVWGSRWSVGKIIFFVNRYCPIIDTSLAVFSITGTSAGDPDLCRLMTRTTTWTFVAGMLVAEIILAMRTYAVWGGRRSILVFLVLWSIAAFIAVVVLVQRFLDAVVFVQIPPFLESLGVGVRCAPLPPNGVTSYPFMVYMVNQAAVAALTLSRAFRQYRAAHNPLIRTMFRDGLLYYVYTLALCIANVAVAVAAPVQYGLLLEMPLHVVNSICCTRVLLNIRGAYFNPDKASHNGVLVFVQEGHSFRWGAGPGSATTTSSDLGHPKETRNTGWVWNDGGDSTKRLSLRPISPFQCELPDLEKDSQLDLSIRRLQNQLATLGLAWPKRSKR
ncbi:hypothetical protein JB92DRAFT_593032 [Gautieria morchelliformis]|nr:hypothetical protein JB92DRAFT_593032 [Gautieria morchelliformis]